MSSINVSFMKRVTTGPYEHEEMSVQFSVDDKSVLASTTQEYRDFVYRTLGKPTTAIQTTTPSIQAATSSQGEDHGNSQESNSEKGNKKSSSKGSKKSRQEEVTQASESSSEEMEEVPSPFTKSAATTEPSSEEAKPKTEKAEKKKKEDGIAYDCEKDEHKSTLTNFLTKLTGGKEWAKDKERSRKISREVLHGQPFLAKDGSILPSFSSLCKEQYGVAQDVL